MSDPNTQPLNLSFWAADASGDNHILYLKVRRKNGEETSEGYLADVNSQLDYQRDAFLQSSRQYASGKGVGFLKFLSDLVNEVILAIKDQLIEITIQHLVRHIISLKHSGDANVIEINADDETFKSIVSFANECIHDYFGFGSEENEEVILNQLTDLSSLYVLHKIYIIWRDENEEASDILEMPDAGAYRVYEVYMESNEDIIDGIVLSVNNIAYRILDQNEELKQHVSNIISSSNGRNRSTRTPTKHSDFFTNAGIIRLATSRLLGMALEAQYRRPDWKADQINLFQAPLAYKTRDHRGTFDVMFYIGDDSSASDDGPSAYDSPIALNILQRWGIIHARLYLGISSALTKTKGEVVDMREADLMYAAGVEEDIKNGNLTRSEARKVVYDALLDLKKLSLYLVSKTGDHHTGRFPVYQIEPLPLYKTSDKSRTIQNIRSRVAPGLWARDLFKFDGGPSFPFPPAIMQIPAKRYPLTALFSLWLAYNQFLFEGGRSVEIRKILREMLPKETPTQEMEGIDLSWELLEPCVVGSLSAATKHARAKVRKQFADMPGLLLERGIKLEFENYDARAFTSWYSFLSTRVKIKNTNSLVNGSNATKKRRKRTASEGFENELYFGDKMKEAMKTKGISQRALAEAIGVSQSLVSQWVNNKTAIPRTKVSIIRKFLGLD